MNPLSPTSPVPVREAGRPTVKRSASPSTPCHGLQRISEAHAAWLPRARRCVEADDPAALLALWTTELLPAFHREEDVLLPELARRLSETDALVVFTLADHLGLRLLARELQCERSRRAAMQGFLERLDALLEFERDTFWPAVQRTLGPGCLTALEAELTT